MRTIDSEKHDKSPAKGHKMKLILQSLTEPKNKE